MFDESSPYNPYMNYGKSKKRGEDIVNETGTRGQLEIVIIRPPWFYGPDQPPRQTLFFQMIRDGKAPILGGGENGDPWHMLITSARDFCCVKKFSMPRGKTYWIADERPYTMNEIVDTIERLLETEFKQACAHKRMRLPGFVGDVAQTD